MARDLLRRHSVGVAQRLDRYDHGVAEARQTTKSWCITHGEPHGSNALTLDDAVYLIDWDTALVAPRERDVWHLDADNSAAADLYRDAGGPAVDHRLLDLYRIQWDLSEIAGYTALFRAAHDDAADARESLANLAHYAQLHQH